jgi:hypothetical protein
VVVIRSDEVAKTIGYLTDSVLFVTDFNHLSNPVSTCSARSNQTSRDAIVFDTMMLTSFIGPGVGTLSESRLRSVNGPGPSTPLDRLLSDSCSRVRLYWGCQFWRLAPRRQRQPR